MFWYMIIKKNLVLHLNKGKCNQSRQKGNKTKQRMSDLDRWLAGWDTIQITINTTVNISILSGGKGILTIHMLLWEC